MSDIDGSGPTYRELVESRTCSPEEQAGPDGETCAACGLKSMHQICKVCMNKDCVRFNK